MANSMLALNVSKLHLIKSISNNFALKFPEEEYKAQEEESENSSVDINQEPENQSESVPVSEEPDSQTDSENKTQSNQESNEIEEHENVNETSLENSNLLNFSIE